MRMKLFTLVAAALASALALAHPRPIGAQPDFKKYYFVLLKAGPNRSGTPEEIERVQRAHLENIARLVRDGKLAIAGPFDDGGDLRGIFILDVPTMEEAEAVVATDPAIQAGRLQPQILAWWSERGRSLP